MGIYLSDQDRDCLTNLRFADDVMLFATSKEQIRNMMCEFNDATEKSGTQDSPRQDENSQQSEQHELRHKKILKLVK